MEEQLLDASNVGVIATVSAGDLVGTPSGIQDEYSSLDDTSEDNHTTGEDDAEAIMSSFVHLGREKIADPLQTLFHQMSTCIRSLLRELVVCNAPRLASIVRKLESLGLGEVDLWPIISSEEFAHLENPDGFCQWTCVNSPRNSCADDQVSCGETGYNKLPDVSFKTAALASTAPVSTETPTSTTTIAGGSQAILIREGGMTGGGTVRGRYASMAPENQASHFIYICHHFRRFFRLSQPEIRIISNTEWDDEKILKTVRRVYEAKRGVIKRWFGWWTVRAIQHVQVSSLSKSLTAVSIILFRSR
jgi:hypothetical protein